MMLKFKIIEDIISAKNIWKKLTPKNSLYDEWDFRYCFYKQNKYPLKFFIGEQQSKIIGVLPLQFNIKNNYLEFFGGNYMDENKVFILPGWEKYIPSFYEAIKDRAYFENLEDNHPFIKQKTIENYIYTLPLDNLKNYSDFIKNFFKGSSIHRKKLRREMEKIKGKNIVIIKNNFADIQSYFKFKIKRWGQESIFNDPNERQDFIDLLKLKYDYHMFTFLLADKKIGVSISILYKNRYLFLEIASDIELIPNIGKYIVMKNIDVAIGLGAQIFDVSRDGESWKERWNFKKIPQYHFKNYKD